MKADEDVVKEKRKIGAQKKGVFKQPCLEGYDCICFIEYEYLHTSCL